MMPSSILANDITQEALDLTLSAEAQSMLSLMAISGAKVHVTWNITVTDDKTGEVGYGHFGDSPEVVVRLGFQEWMRRKNGET
jgi:hypothetical protein